MWKIQTYITRTEQNNDHTRIIHKIQFRSSFNASGKLVLFWIFKVSIRFVFMRSYAETLKKNIFNVRQWISGQICFFHFKNVKGVFRVLKNTEAVARRCSIKQVFLEILQNSQENICVRVSFFNKVAGLEPY